jgi:dTDP-4-amino-4,6-dideoxygalactose transaminase
MGIPSFYGINCRMSELQGAVAGVQLDRLEGIITDCRANRSRLMEAIGAAAASKDIRFRRSHDEAGDTGIALVLLAPDSRTAGVLNDSLRGVGIDAEVLFDASEPDLHVAHHWSPVLEMRSAARHGPWADQVGEFDYGPERIERTCGLLSRSVHLDVSPDLTSLQIDQIGDALLEALALI